MSWADRISVEEVVDLESFCSYARQVAGVPYPTKANLGAARKEMKQLFEMYPKLTWKAMCQVVLWAKIKKKRYAHIVQLIRSYRWAYQDGFLPELDAVNEDDELTINIESALERETDPEWRRRLSVSRGPGRKVVYAAWLKFRSAPTTDGVG